MDVCPLAKPSKLLVLDLVNQENSSNIAEEQLIFGEVEESLEGGNTALRLTAAPDAPWNSFVDTSYDRLDLGTLFHNERAEVSLPKGATAADLICHLNFTYDLKFDVNEFDVVPQEDGELPELYKVTAKAGNMAYIGSVDVFADLNRMPLSARLTVTDLNGFGYNAGGDVVVSHNKTMPATWAFGHMPTGNRNGFEIAENDEMFMGGRSSWSASTNNAAIFQAAGYSASANPPYYTCTSTGALYNNTIYRNAPVLSLFMGLKAEQGNFEHLLDGYDIAMEMTVSALNGGGGVIRSSKVIRFGTRLRVEFTDGQRIDLVQKIQNGVTGYEATIGIPYTPTGMFGSLTASTMAIPGTTQRPACCTGMVTFKLTATRKKGLAKPIELIYRTALFAQ